MSATCTHAQGPCSSRIEWAGARQVEGEGAADPCLLNKGEGNSLLNAGRGEGGGQHAGNVAFAFAQPPMVFMPDVLVARSLLPPSCGVG